MFGNNQGCDLQFFSDMDEGVVNIVTLKLLPEALPSLVVQEDEKMIGWLGRATFVSACISGPEGWQEGVCFVIPLISITF